ncbi:GLPGLI family protein [Chryseobacterium sp. FH2]|uniref:GLPGLI family protein n=1 Tax=Chryseobacterium sp. FH2 TaxID=1674291 RepID=UPI00069D7887|nr:GLPGLI family protein [Chryseobacterium sp. FH2]
MRNKLLAFFALFLITAAAYGQTVRYVYETSVNPDSINLVSLKNEKTFLDVKGNQSLFISENRLIKDSLLASFKPEEKKENKKGEKDFSKLGGKKHIEPTFFEYFIIKNIPEQKIYYYDKVFDKQIYYQEDRPLKWEITNVTEKQNGYSAQKAVANFGGRIWTAWFTKDINVSDGPYKFSGLPGLIVKLEDDKGDYKFDLVKKIIIKNSFEESVSSDAKLSTRVDFHGDKAALELEMSKNKKAFSGNERQMSSGGGRRGGGMHGGGMGGDGHMGGRRGMPPGGNEGGMAPSVPNAGLGNVSFQSLGNQNPIELK